MHKDTHAQEDELPRDVGKEAPVRPGLDGSAGELVGQFLNNYQDIEDLVEKLFSGIYGEDAMAENPELYEEFQAEVILALDGIPEEAKRYIITQYLERFIENDLDGLSDMPTPVTPDVPVQVVDENTVKKSGAFNIGSIFHSAGSFIAAAASSLAGIVGSVETRQTVSGPQDEKIATNPVLSIQELLSVEHVIDAAAVSESEEALNDKLEMLHKQYRDVILESLTALAEAKAMQERDRLHGLFAEDVSEAAKKAKQIADAEIVIQEAIVVLSAFRGTDLYQKLERIAERLKQIDYVHRAFKNPLVLSEVVESADVNGFAVLAA